jgi:hypothetical protein
MQSIFSDHERRRLHCRIDALTPDAPRRWGRMTAHQMVCHLTDSVESAFDEEAEAPGTGPLSREPLKWLVLHVLPWPKGKMESPERLTRRRPTVWDADVRALHDALERLAARDPSAHWPPSDVFGTLSRREWGALLRTHINHHLRQFGA